MPKAKEQGIASLLFFLGILVLLCSEGCAVRRYYPVCVYGPSPTVHSASDLKSGLDEFAKAAAGSKTELTLSPNLRVAVVVTSRRGQKRLAKAWPRAACIGPGRDQEEYTDYKHCVNLLSRALSESGGLMPLGDWSDGKGLTLFCCHEIDSSH